jgi:hypothetical protein
MWLMEDHILRFQLVDPPTDIILFQTLGGVRRE